MLEAIQSGVVSLDDLDSDEFEDLVVEIIRTAYGHFGESASITRDRRYDVDIVIRESKRGPLHAAEELHFVEVKCYGKGLSLDTAAKAYCAALRYHPRTLTIACKSAVQPQPLDYGRALFGDGRVTQLFILNLRHALDLHGLEPVLGESRSDVRAPLFRLQSWQVWRNTTFTAELVATSDSAPPVVMAAGEATYELVVVAVRPSCEAAPEFYLSLEGGYRLSPDQVESFGEVVRISFTLPLEVLSRCPGQAELTAADGRRLTLEAIRLPRFEVEATRAILPDLRRDTSDYWGRRLMEGGGPRVLLLHGEGGIGKTYLCERIAASLNQRFGTRCAHISVDSATSELTFFRLILSVLFPPNIDRSQGSVFEQEAIRSLLRSLDAGLDVESDAAADALASGRVARIDLHAQITLAAKLLASRSLPVAIFLSNCQHLTPELLLGLRAFLIALDQFGWNNCRIICEYRDQSGVANTYLREFVETVLANRIGNAAVFEVLGIDAPTTLEMAKALFPGADARAVTSSLIKKTAGNPFLLENLLQHYRDTGVISRRESGGYGILDHARFNAVESHISESVRYLLAERLMYLDSVLKDATGEADLGSRALGLAALMGPTVDERVWRAVGLEETAARKIQSTFESHGILTRSLDDGSPSFSHELMRAACRERLSQVSSGARTVEDVLRLVDGAEPSDFELRGRLHAFLRNEREAMNEFNRGYELAAHGNQDFSMQKRCLAGISQLYGQRHSLSDRSRLMYVEVLFNLGWAERNSGCSIHAAGIYRQALDLVEQAEPGSDIWTPAVTLERTAALAHALFGLSLSTLEIEGAVGWARSAIQNAQDMTRLGQILNRLIRLCNMLGYADAGASAARLASMFAAASRDPEVLAVLCTDIGDLYLQAEPEASRVLRVRGLAEANRRRQQLHNEICAAISDVYACSGWASDESISRMLSDARTVSVRNILARLSLYRGAKAWAEGSMGLARLYFLEAGQIALLSGDLWLEALANNNLAVVSWSENDEGRVNAEADRVLATVERMVRESPGESVVLDLVDLAQGRAELLCPIPPQLDDGRQLPLPGRAPACCGSLNVLIRNLEALGKAVELNSLSPPTSAIRREVEESGLAVLRSEGHPLAVRHDGRTLVLALE